MSLESFNLPKLKFPNLINARLFDGSLECFQILRTYVFPHRVFLYLFYFFTSSKYEKASFVTILANRDITMSHKFLPLFFFS